MINSNIKMLRGIIFAPKDRKTTDTDKRDPIEFDLIILIKSGKLINRHIPLYTLKNMLMDNFEKMNMTDR